MVCLYRYVLLTLENKYNLLRVFYVGESSNYHPPLHLMLMQQHIMPAKHGVSLKLMMITCTAAFMEMVVFLKLYIDEQFFNLITLQVDREKLHTSSIHQFIDNKHLGLTKYAVYLEKKII